MKKDRAITPRGHSNMASAHLILNGEMHLRHYEKIGQGEENLIIKPTVWKIAKIGDNSLISDEKDNIHWFIANTETAISLKAPFFTSNFTNRGVLSGIEVNHSISDILTSKDKTIEKALYLLKE